MIGGAHRRPRRSRLCRRIVAVTTASAVAAAAVAAEAYEGVHAMRRRPASRRYAQSSAGVAMAPTAATGMPPLPTIFSGCTSGRATVATLRGGVLLPDPPADSSAERV